MDPGAQPMSMGQKWGPLPGPGAALGMAAQAVGQMMMLPWNVFAGMAVGMTRLMDGARSAVAGSGGGQMPALAPPAAARGNEWTIPVAGVAGDATTFRKETPQMSEERCDIDDCKVKLYKYTIVSLRRGRERILEQDQLLIRDPMDECDFDGFVIARYVRANPDTPVRWLRVCSELLCTWEKQPLHYHEKQLRYLEEIANSQRRLAKSQGGYAAGGGRGDGDQGEGAGAAG